jgi:tetratricopeptide (TPR) repeat protein
LGRPCAAPNRELTAHAGILNDPGMRLFASIIILGLAALPAAAQTPSPRNEATKPEAKAPEAKPSTMDDLFDRLAKAKDENEGKGVASLIERRWSRSGSDTADLLMSRAAQAVEAKEFPLAIELLDRVLALQPQWTEAWYRRANVFFLLEDPASAMADIRQVLDREPRHFGAWTGLGHIFMASDDKARALASYRRALQIHPQLSTVQSLVERLTPQVDGRDL